MCNVWQIRLCLQRHSGRLVIGESEYKNGASVQKNWVSSVKDVDLWILVILWVSVRIYSSRSNMIITWSSEKTVEKLLYSIPSTEIIPPSILWLCSQADSHVALRRRVYCTVTLSSPYETTAGLCLWWAHRMRGTLVPCSSEYRLQWNGCQYFLG